MSSSERVRTEKPSTGPARAPSREGAPEAAVVEASVATLVRRAVLPAAPLAPRDVLHLQRTLGNRAVGSLLAARGGMVQRAGVAERVQAREEQLGEEAVSAVRLYAKGSKKKSHATWENILTRALVEKPFWDTVKDHVMLGEDETPPKGYHSKARGAGAHARGVGGTSPDNAGDSVAYKQWTRHKNDNTYDDLKISTFFPNNWSEEKIRAAVLLRTAGAEHQVEARFDLKKQGDTIYPDLDLENPPEPE